MENRATKAGLGYIIANYLLKGLSFFTLPIFTRLMVTKDFGIYNTFLAYENILSVILVLSLYSSFNAARFKFKDSIMKYVSCCITVSFCVTICVLILSQLFYSKLFIVFSLDRCLMILLIVYSLASGLIVFFNSYVGLNYQFISFIKISAISAVGNVIISLIFILTFFSNNRGVGRILGIAIPSILIAIYVCLYFFRKEKPNLNSEYVKFGLSYSLPIIPHSLAQIILNQFDRIMITSMIGSEESGVYSFAYTIFSLLLIT